MSRRKNLSKASVSRDAGVSLRISEVARRVGISSSALRAWETLGLIKPQRTRSRYRLYSEMDVRLLKRAIFLRRARGLNPAAIVHGLKQQGVVSPAENSASPGLRFRRLGWFSKRPRTRTDARFHRNLTPHRALLSHQYSFLLRTGQGQFQTRSARRTK